ncbi:MAG: DUF4340 domain-containing protein [Myxococcota bacterium]|nr:DUF4340 domain-containing protein [Myxococcota bacterium]
MNPRNTAILLVVALLLGAFVWFYEIEGEQGRLDAEARQKRIFPDVESEGIEWLALRTTDDHPVRAERLDGGWRLVEPLDFPGDDFALDAVASALAELSSESVYEDPQEAAVYGLDDEAAELRFGVGGREYTLRTGDKTPLGSNHYARVGSDAVVYTVPSFRVNAMRKSLEDLRDKRILDFDTSAVERLTASWPGSQVVLARSDGVWRLESPVEGEVDEQTVQDLISDLSFLRATSFADEPLPDEVTGLDEPDFAVELAVASEGSDERRIAFAVGSGEVEGHRYVRAGRPTLFRISSDRLEDFPREVVDYRFKELAKFTPIEAQSLDIVFRPESGDPLTITALRDAGDWKSQPEAIDPSKLRRVLEELSRLEAERVLAESAGPDELAGLGLAPPRVTFVVQGEQGEDGAETLAEVRLGEIQGSDGIVAQRSDRETVFRVAYEVAEYLPVSIEAMRNRFLEPDLPAEPELPAGFDPDAGADSGLGLTAPVDPGAVLDPSFDAP